MAQDTDAAAATAVKKSSSAYTDDHDNDEYEEEEESSPCPYEDRQFSWLQTSRSLMMRLFREILLISIVV